MASVKQILRSLLSEYSQKETRTKDLKKVTDRVKSGLLLYGSTSNSMWNMVEELTWMSHSNRPGNKPITTQGLALDTAKIVLSDFFELITEGNEIPKKIQEDYPEITLDAYRSGVHFIGLLLRSLEWSKTYEDIENNGNLNLEEKERFLNSYQKKLNEFREDPEDYS